MKCSTRRSSDSAVHGIPAARIHTGQGAICLLLCALLACLPGCSKRGPQVFRVSGTVTRGGKPVPGLMIHFVPSNGRPSWGQTDRDGHYELHYVARQMGAASGAHWVSITLRPSAGSPDLLPGQPAPLSADQQAIVRRYGSPETSPLTAQVDREGQVIDFALD